MPLCCTAFRAAILSALTLAAATSARADVVVDTFDSGGPYSGTGNITAARASFSMSTITANRLAVRFQVPAGGADFTLDSLSLPISQSLVNVTGSFSLRIRLLGDTGGGSGPGAPIATLLQGPSVPIATNPFTSVTTINSANHPVLPAGAYFWIVTDLSSMPVSNAPSWSATYRWWESAAGPTSTTKQQQVNGALPSDPWPTTSSSNRVAYRIEGTAVTAACCNPATGACAVLNTGSCRSLNLTPMSESATCSPNPCPVPTGACCAGATCSLSAGAAACSAGSSYLGDRTACSPVVRAGTVNACCTADFNNSASVSVQDIFDYLAMYFAGC